MSDSYGKNLDSHNMGAIYSRIKPAMSAEKPAGQWQAMNITLLDRHVTVVLNDKVIIDNEPLLGCTGGALWSDEFKPGPIYLQGDRFIATCQQSSYCGKQETARATQEMWLTAQKTAHHCRQAQAGDVEKEAIGGFA